MFDNQFKTILLYEAKILKSKRFIFNRVFDILLAIILAFLFCNAGSQVPSNIPFEEIEKEIKVLFQFLFLVISIIFMFISSIPFFNEFKKEKSDKIYEVILISPISLLKLATSKLISLFLINYIFLFSTFISMFIVLSIYHFNPFSIISFEVGLMIFMIIPLYMCLYLSFGLWMVLRFKNALTNLLILVPFVLPFALEGLMHLFGKSLLESMPKWIGDSFITGNLIHYPILIFSVLGWLIGFLIMFTVMKRFNKEKITL